MNEVKLLKGIKFMLVRFIFVLVKILFYDLIVVIVVM